MSEAKPTELLPERKEPEGFRLRVLNRNDLKLEDYYYLEDLLKRRTPSPAQPKCVKCGHRATIDGVCQVGTGPTHPVTGYKAICGCKCEFPPAQPDERLSTFTLAEIREGYEALRGNVECLTCSRLLAYIADLLSLLDSQQSPKERQ